jgi:hypothetical protein
VRTVVDLRNDDEVAAGAAAPRPDGIPTVRVPLDGVEAVLRDRGGLTHDDIAPLRARLLG